MPQSPNSDLNFIETSSNKEIEKFGGKLGKTEIEAIAFGLKALKLIFIMDEDKGSTEPLEREIIKIKGVNSVETLDVRRAIG